MSSVPCFGMVSLLLEPIVILGAGLGFTFNAVWSSSYNGFSKRWETSGSPWSSSAEFSTDVDCEVFASDVHVSPAASSVHGIGS